MNLTTALNLITTFTVIMGVVFAGAQLRQLRLQRAREAALQMLQAAQTPAFMEAIDIVFHLPEGLPRNEIMDRVGEKMAHLLVLFGTFECLGILVYRREIDLDLVEDFFSGPIVLCWQTLRRYFLETREASGRENYGEWLQWLAEQIAKRESVHPALPAYLEFGDWKAHKS